MSILMILMDVFSSAVDFPDWAYLILGIQGFQFVLEL